MNAGDSGANRFIDADRFHNDINAPATREIGDPRDQFRSSCLQSCACSQISCQLEARGIDICDKNA
jgi:hypothetical protein